MPAHWRVLADLFLLSMFAGFYSVPLYALIQSRCEPTHRARIARYTIAKVRTLLVSNPSRLAEVSSRLETEYRQLNGE